MRPVSIVHLGLAVGNASDQKDAAVNAFKHETLPHISAIDTKRFPGLQATPLRLGRQDALRCFTYCRRGACRYRLCGALTYHRQASKIIVEGRDYNHMV